MASQHWTNSKYSKLFSCWKNSKAKGWFWTFFTKRLKYKGMLILLFRKHSGFGQRLLGILGLKRAQLTPADLQLQQQKSKKMQHWHLPTVLGHPQNKMNQYELGALKYYLIHIIFILGLHLSLQFRWWHVSFLYRNADKIFCTWKVWH